MTLQTDPNPRNVVNEVNVEAEVGAQSNPKDASQIDVECEVEVQSNPNDASQVDVVHVDGEVEVQSNPSDLSEMDIVPSLSDAVTQTPNESSLQDKKLPLVDVAIQTKYEFPPVVYEAEIDLLKREIEALKIETEWLVKHPAFSFRSIEDDDVTFTYYTGIHLDTFAVLQEVCETVCAELPTYDGKNINLLNFADQMLLSLMKLRLDLDFIDLAKRFGISRTTAYRIFRTILPALHMVVFQAFMGEIPSRTKIQRCMPACFDAFSACRLVIDSTEMRCQSPSHLAEQKASYSSYKHFPSVKITIGVLPNGSAVACSPCYPGSTSDKAIIKHSNFFKDLKPGDLVLADKGFTVYEDLPPGVSLNIPPFLTRKQFTPSEVWETRSIAKARIHIERFNSRLKNYRITRLIPYRSFKYVSMVVQTCIGLVNFQNSLLKEVEHLV